MPDLQDVRRRFHRIVSAPRGAAAAAAPVRSALSRPFSAYLDEDVEAASAIAAGLSETTRRVGGAADGLDAALSQAERLLAAEAVAGTVQYALKLFATHDPTAKRFLHLAPLERRQPNAVRGVGEQPDAEHDAKE